MNLRMKHLRSLSLAAAYIAASTMFANTATSADKMTAASAAVADKGRPEADRARDADRKPVDMLEFAKITPGQTVVDYIPGKGYFTRLFSVEVGQKGLVYAVTPQLLLDKLKGHPLPPPVSAEPERGNVHEVVATADSLNVPGKVDLFWTSQNYHDVHNWTGTEGIARLNKRVFDVLKPGGLYIVLDHAGAPGLDEAGMAKLHRIDEALVKKEVIAAGFVLDGESSALRNPEDKHDTPVFDAAIRGKTDQFVLRFKKPR
jgi:predicted methyltransferase